MPDNSNFDILASQSVSGGESNQTPNGVNSELRRVFLEFATTAESNELDNTQLRQRWDGRQVWIALHGWNANYDNFRELVSEIKDANPEDIVLSLNWLEASSTADTGLQGINTFANYYAATWIGPVAEVVAQHLKLWGINPQSLNLVGHSLGSLLASEIAYQLNQQNGQDPPNYQAANVSTITALDPPSENALIRSSDAIPKRFKFGYVYPRNGQDVRPVPFDQVSNFSRSFLGRSSIAGNVEFASWADEAITIDFGLEAAANPDGQHGDVYRAFQEWIAANGTKLAKDLFGLNDKSRHVNFKADAFGAFGNPAPPSQVFEGVLIADPSTQQGRLPRIRGFYARLESSTFSNAYVVYGTEKSEVLFVEDDKLRIRSNLVNRDTGRVIEDINFNEGYIQYYLGKGNDIVRVGNAQNLIDGGEGNDVLTGGNISGLTDFLYGGAGNDKLYGGLGIDYLYGDDNDEPYGRDELYGDYGDDALSGGGGNDKLSGGAGDDFIDGDNNNDNLVGDEGNDRLSGGAGNDTLIGVESNLQLIDALTQPGIGERDLLWGGAGADKFVLGEDRVFYQGLKIADYADIQEFNVEEGDRIQLKGNRENYSFRQEGDDTHISYHDLPQPLDVVLLTDLTKSFKRELTTVKQVMPELVNKLQASYQDVQLRVASFTDRTGDREFKYINRTRFVEYVGELYGPTREIVSWETTRGTQYFNMGGYSYLQHSGLSNDLSTSIAAINDLKIYSHPEDGVFVTSNEYGEKWISKYTNRYDDLDRSEAQLDALFDMANGSFRNNSTRIAVITTDAPFHQAGDGRFDTFLNGGHWEYDGGYIHWESDYVSIDRLRNALVTSNVVPVFAVTKNVIGDYADLVEQLGVGAVIPLTSNPNKLMGAIADAIPGDLVGIVKNTITGNLQGHVTYR